MAGDLAGFRRLEQANGAAGEDAAVALQIRGPGAVGDLVRKDLGDVDRRRIERFDEQGDPPRHLLAVLRLAPLLLLLDPRFDGGGGLAEREHLPGQPFGRAFRRLDRLLRHRGELGHLGGDGLLHRAGERLARGFAERAGAGRDDARDGVPRVHGGLARRLADA
jgi:hypothetical protein